MPGTLVAEATTDNVFVQLETQTCYGKLYATVKLPRQLLAHGALQQLADGEVALLAVLNAGFPADVTNVGRGTRVRALLGLQGALAAARHVINNTKGCKLAEKDVVRLISESGCLETARTQGPNQRPTIVAGTMSFTVSDPTTIDAAAKDAADAASLTAAGIFNSQILDTTVQRAAMMGSNSRLEKSDKLVTCHAGAAGGRARRVQIGGVKLQQLQREAIAAHRARFCRVELGLPQAYGMHEDVTTGQFYAKPSRSDSLPIQSSEVASCMADGDESHRSWQAEAAQLAEHLDSLDVVKRSEAEKELTVGQVRILIHKLLCLTKINYGMTTAALVDKVARALLVCKTEEEFDKHLITAQRVVRLERQRIIGECQQEPSWLHKVCSRLEQVSFCAVQGRMATHIVASVDGVAVLDGLEDVGADEEAAAFLRKGDRITHLRKTDDSEHVDVSLSHMPFQAVRLLLRGKVGDLVCLCICRDEVYMHVSLRLVAISLSLRSNWKGSWSFQPLPC